ncbi:MAG: hypothetical protein HY675_25060 [Chloroflexi bacterium]|nr:hypothetical protein [Chloroflexota bacterium]
MVRNELRGVVAGEADNAVKAVALARTLRPDLMVVDDRLPHMVGLDGVRLSRIAGLDAALSVVHELPRAKVLLVSHTEAALAADNHRNGNGRMELCLYPRADAVAGQPERQVIFAALREKATPALRRRVITVSETGVLVGGLSMLGGLGLMLTILLAPAGVTLAAAGGLVLLLSLGARATAAVWPTLVRSGERQAGTLEERDDIEANLQRLPVI